MSSRKNKFKWKPVKLIIQTALWCLFASIIFLDSVNQYTFRFLTHGLEISSDVNIPPYSALEDQNIILKDEELDESSQFEAQPLLPGDPSDLKRPVEQLVVSSSEIAPPAEEAPTVLLAGIKITQETVVAESEAIDLNLDSKIYDESGELLDLQARKQTIAAHFQQQSRMPTSVSEVMTRAKELVQKELLASQGVESNDTRVVSGVIIKAHQPSPAVLAKNTEKKEVTPTPLVEHESIDKLLHPNTISGNLSLVGGLAFTGTEGRLEVFIERYGQAFEKGKIYLSDGRYIIDPQDINGFLVAELRTLEGVLIGRGSLNLFDFPQTMKAQVHLENIHLIVEPVLEGVNIALNSAYGEVSKGHALESPQLYIEAINRHLVKNEKHFYVDDTISKDSHLIFDYGAKGHWGGLNVSGAQSLVSLKVYSEKLVHSLIELVSPSRNQKEFKNLGVVIGAVTVNGQPISGAEVELASEGGVLRGAYYFEGELPIAKRSTTSRNGKFAIVGVDPGVHSIRAKYKGRDYPGQLVVTGSKKVSEVHLDLSSRRAAQMKIFDALTGEGLSAHFKRLGFEEVLETNIFGEAVLDQAYGSGIQSLEIDPGSNYPVYSLAFDGTVSGISAPLLSMAQISALVSRAGVALRTGTGIVLGHVLGEDYYLVENGRVIESGAELIFFNSNGEYSETGVAGGGFLRINKTQGLDNIAVVGKQNQRVVAKVVVTDPDLVHVTTFEFK